MNSRIVLAATMLFAATASQAADPARQLVKLAAGESATIYGTTYRAAVRTVAIASLSSELATVAVIDGRLADGKVEAGAGEALVIPLDGKGARRFGFDARRLAATLPPEWTGETSAPLERIASRQKRARFWGLLEPVNFNANAPVSPQPEAVRMSYLGNATVAALRHEAQGNPQTLAALTAKAFAAALAARDASTAADLIDPKPFTDTGAGAANWQSARAAFAAKLAADASLVGAMAEAPVAVANDQTAFDAGGYRIRLAPRDRAMFVTSVEPQS